MGEGEVTAGVEVQCVGAKMDVKLDTTKKHLFIGAALLQSRLD